MGCVLIGLELVLNLQSVALLQPLAALSSPSLQRLRQRAHVEGSEHDWHCEGIAPHLLDVRGPFGKIARLDRWVAS
eukprot:2221454-Alexandrium_andersonii.AAC.1